MPNQTSSTECPTCGKRVDYAQRASNPFFPFCSERCQLIDLGKWFCEEHRIEEPLSENQERSDPGDEPKGEADDSPRFSG